MQHSAIFAGFGTPRAMPKHSPWNSLARGPGPCRVKSSRSSNTVPKTAAGSFGLRATQPDEQNEKDGSFRAFGICSWKVGSAQLRQMSRIRRMFPFALLESAGSLLESPGPQGIESAVLSRSDFDEYHIGISSTTFF